MKTDSLPTKSYNNIREMKWTNPRLCYIMKLQSHTPRACPECHGDLVYLEDETYCEECGLVVSATIEYVAGIRIHLPYGRQ
jgi:predicted amidophosphoribosyltransferase